MKTSTKIIIEINPERTGYGVDYLPPNGRPPMPRAQSATYLGSEPMSDAALSFRIQTEIRKFLENL